jgi:phenylacetate-coenzyme A ligase PaaK-like adenylate-forming protein
VPSALLPTLQKFVPPQDTWDPVDVLLYSPDTYFTNYNDAVARLLPALRHSFQHHYTNNAFYHRLCETENITPDQIKTTDDLKKIPLLPDTIFKDYPTPDKFPTWLQAITSTTLPTPHLGLHPNHDDIIAAYQKIGIHIMFTSGTSGRFSFVPRDEQSWNRVKYAAMKCVSELMDYKPTDHVILLIPNPKLTNLTIASLFGIAYDLFPGNVDVALETTQITTQLLRLQQADAIGLSEKLKAKALNTLTPLVQKRADQRMITILERLQEQGQNINIAGPPFWLNSFLDRIQTEGHHITFPNGQILTGGGWKSQESTRLTEPALRTKTQQTLSIPQERYHDVYAMSECSSVFLSCTGHYKHVPPTIYPLVLDDTLTPLGYNKPGRFAFLDPLPRTYPGFIITGDRVTLRDHCPACNHQGPVLDTEVTRLPGTEGRGCAAVMAELLQENKE